MSRSVQTMTFMPLASVVDWTCSMPGTFVAGAGLAGLGAADTAIATADNRTELSARKAREFGMRHTSNEECAF
jgi:hypothetical protein